MRKQIMKFDEIFDNVNTCVVKLFDLQFDENFDNVNTPINFHIPMLISLIILHDCMMFRSSAYVINKLRNTDFFFRPMSAYSSLYTYPLLFKKNQIGLKKSEINVFLAPRKSPLNCESNSIFYDNIVKQFISYVTRSGGKQKARILLEECFEIIKRSQLERYNLDENEIIFDAEYLLSVAIENCKPILLLTSIKRGGVKYHVPIPTSKKKSYFLAMKWLLESAREKEKNVLLPSKLAWDILDASQEKGRIIKKKNDLHRHCEENRAYANYRWG